MKIPHTVLERRTLCFSLYKNHKLKIAVMSWSSQKKKEGIFSTVYILSERNFFRMCFFSMYSVLNTLSKYISHIKNYISKTSLHTLLLLVSKIVESLHVSLRYIESKKMLTTSVISRRH